MTQRCYGMCTQRRRTVLYVRTVRYKTQPSRVRRRTESQSAGAALTTKHERGRLSRYDKTFEENSEDGMMMEEEFDTNVIGEVMRKAAIAMC